MRSPQHAAHDVHSLCSCTHCRNAGFGMCRHLGLGLLTGDRRHTHGFRFSFQDRVAECTVAPQEVCELALAHANRDRV